MSSSISNKHISDTTTSHGSSNVSPMKTFLLRFSHFFSANTLSRALGFLTFPILTRVLSESEYGILGLVTVTMMFAVALAKAGLSDGITRFYSIYSKTSEQLRIFSSTVIIRGITLSLLILFLYVMLFPKIYKYLGIDSKFLLCFMVMAAYLFIRPLNIIVYNILKVAGKTIFYNIVGLCGRVIETGLSLLLLIYIVHELYGFFIGVVIAELLVAVALFYWFFSNFQVRYNEASYDLTKKLIKFGLPLLFYELSFLLLSYVDRYMIIAYHGEAVLGIYSVGYNLAMYIAEMLNTALLYSVIPVYVGIYETQGKDKTEEFLERCMRYLLIAVIPICFGYFAISKDLLVTFASVKYVQAAAFSPIILVGSFLLLINNILNAGLYLNKNTMKMLLIMLLSVLVNIIMNFILLPRYGVMGATIATLASCLVATILTAYFSYKYIIVRIDLNTIGYYLIVSGIMYFIVLQIETTIIWLNLIAKIITGALIIMVCVLLKEKEMTAQIKEMYRSRRA